MFYYRQYLTVNRKRLLSFYPSHTLVIGYTTLNFSYSSRAFGEQGS